MSKSLDYTLAVAAGRADPSWRNERGDPNQPPEMPRGHIGDIPPPRFDAAQTTSQP